MTGNLLFYFDSQKESYVLTKPGIAATILLIAALLAFSVFVGARSSDKAKKTASGSATKKNTRRLVFSAAAMALGILTSEFLPTPALPMGGSITLFSMLFISLIGYWYGLGSGLAAALAYGLLQFVLDPKFIAIGQLFLDYILAFGALGLSGFFSNRKHGLITGYVVGVLGRYVFSVISGVIYYGMYAPDGVPVLEYSMLYQATYLLPEMILTLILLAVAPVRKGIDAIKKTALAETE